MSLVIRVAILDDHQSVIDGYKFRLSKTSGVEIVAATTYGSELESMLANHPVDVLLLDVNVPTAPDNPNPFPILQMIPGLLQKYPNLHVLVISMYHQGTLIKAVIEAGASGYLLKDDRSSIVELGTVIRSVASGGIFFSQQAHFQLRKQQTRDPLLTPRQLEVLSLCAAYPDATTAELASHLHVANSTLRNLLSSAYLRLGVHNCAAAIAKARQVGLITPDEAVADYPLDGG